MTIETIEKCSEQTRPILVLLGKGTFVSGDLKMHNGVSNQIPNQQPKI